jgi:hypothetical protein
MRKWTARIGAFILSIIMGSAASSTWHAHRLISLCDIDANPEKYAGKIVRLRVMVFNEVFSGKVVNTGRQISACSVCNSEDNLPGASVDLNPQQINLLAETRHVWLQEHVLQEGRSYMTEAILVGRLEPPSGIPHCFSAKYHISQARIERVIRMQEFENNEQFVRWMKSKSQ